MSIPNCAYGQECTFPKWNETAPPIDCCVAIYNTCDMALDAFVKSTSSFDKESWWINSLILLSCLGSMCLYFIIKADEKL